MSAVIVIGSGLAGMCAAYEAKQWGAVDVLVLDKNSSYGGNSMKASSGINCVGPVDDSSSLFYKDTIVSAGGEEEACVDIALVDKLVCDANEAVDFLKANTRMPLQDIVRLGGHTVSRTRRCTGAGLVNGMRDKLLTKGVRFLADACVRELIVDTNRVHGVRLENGREILGCVIVCTGGFGASRELLRDHAPSVAEYPTTNGAFATGDGLRMLVKVGAQLRGLEHVQLHPTGIIDPSDREAKTKFLAPEAFRGFGGLLLNADGDRFVDELANRQVVADAMRRQDGQRAFLLVPLDAANHIGRSQMEFYNTRGLCRYARNRSELCEFVGASPKMRFDQPVYVFEVCPVVHYCMGGVVIDEDGRVLDEHNRPIGGVYAAGEVTSSVHGRNRLGGNSLLECVVFGRAAGKAAASEHALVKWISS